MKLKQHKKIFALFVVMFIFYAFINSTFAIYRETKTDSINLSILDPNGMVNVIFNPNGGNITSNEASKTVQVNTAVGSLPTPTRTDYNFDGWYTDPDLGVRISEQTVVTGTTVTYYAHWVKIVCKMAAPGTLHSETCISDGSCAGTGGGYSANDTIYYGTIPTANSPIVGDAYDCDVNDDGTWDPLTERFYYVRAYGPNSDPTENAVLVHFTSFDENGQMDSSISRGSHLYDEALTYLPTSATWDNPALIEMDGNVTRFISSADLTAACGSASGGNKFANCRFYLEHTRYQSKELGRAGLWLVYDGNAYHRIHTEQLNVAVVDHLESVNAARPTIQIPSNTLENYTGRSQYTILFNPNGGSLDASETSRDVYDGDMVGTLPVPTYANHQFVGWFSAPNSGTQITASTIVNGSNTYYAHWVDNSDNLDYVFYIPGECVFTSTGIQNGTDGDCISTINPTGNSIDYTESALSAKKYIDTGIALYSTDNVERDFEVGFTIVSYNSSDNEKRSTIIGSKAEINNSQLKYPGFVFRRNESTDDFLLQSRMNLNTNAEQTFPSADVQSVKIFREDGDIYYSINGGTKTLLNEAYNPVFSLTTWIGANTANAANSSAQRFFVGTLSNIYIKLKGDATYTVSFNPNYQGATITTRSVGENETVGELPTPATRNGYTFLGWFTGENDGTQITSSTTVTADVTYYAHWHEDVTVTLQTNGGTVTPNTITVPYNTPVGNLPTPEKTGNSFVGWYQDSELTTPATAETVITEDTDFYAKWLPNVTVTLNANSGTVTPGSITVGQGSAVGTLPTPERSGYTFVGWFQDSELTIPATSETIVDADTTYYAKWVENITVTFNPGDGSVTPTTKTFPTGTAIGELPTPELQGYDFEGWFTDDGTYLDEVTTTTVFNTSTTVFAKWIDGSYVACIGTKCYSTLSAAINATPDVNEQNPVKTTITIIKDIETSAFVNIPSNKWVELDINTHTISGPSGTDHSVFINNGTLDLINGTITSSGGYIIENVKGTVNIYGGTLTFDSANQTEHKVMEIKGGTVNISGGTLSCNSKAATINVKSGATLNVSGGTITASNTYKGQAIYNDGGTTTISGDAILQNVSATGGNGRACVHNNAGTVNILGGTITSAGNSAVKNNGSMTIGKSDTTLDITSPVLQGAIYGLETVSGKTVYVYDGIFKGKGTTADKAISDENVVNSGLYTIVHDTETIGGTQYDVAYLEDQTVNYTVTFNVNGGDSVSLNTQTYTDVGPIGTLPTATKANSAFLGWFTSATGGDRVFSTTEVNADITYYAHYTTSTIVCKPATTLHSSGGTDFGQIPTSSTFTGGDAFDCDVNGDGTYDATDERFYYLTDTNDGKAVMIYYNNVIQSGNNAASSCSTNGITYGTTFSEGPTNAMTGLPTTAQWPNVNIYTEPRTITNESGTTIVSDFVYTGKAARFANLDEIKAATNSGINVTTNELDNYAFLLENTASMDSNCRSNYWLETTRAAGGAYRINGAAANKSLGYGTSATATSTLRPVIEVPYSSIQGIVNSNPTIVEFDTIPTAMRNYFNNVSTWNSGQDDSNYSSFNSSMISNLTTNNCAYYQADNVNTQYGSVFCDQPNKYDTGTTGNIRVYEYDESSGITSNTEATYVSNDNGKLYNFIPGKTYYWESATDSTINGFVRPTGERRLITINGTNRQTRNVRDLGGLPVDTNGDGTIDGKVKYQKLYRGEKIWGTNRNGDTRAEFEKLGIYNELDLRTPGSEVIASEEDQLSNYISNEIVHYKIDYNEFGSPADEPRFNGKSYYQLARDAAIDVMQRIVAGNDDYAMYFHCRIGADRTGTLAYILEGLLGVPTEYRHQDYELTTFFGLRERTRYYLNKDSNNYKFIYLKKAIRHATPNNNEVTGEENVMDWFLLEGNSTATCNDIGALITQFRAKMIDYN